MSDDILRERVYKLKDPETGEEITLSQLPSGNYKIEMNSNGEMRPDIFEALIEDMKNMLHSS